MKAASLLVVLVSLATGLLAGGAQEDPSAVSIVNLYDAFGYEKEGTTRDWGFSALIRFKGKTILFDAGNSADLLERNAEALGVDLRKVDLGVLSHRHYDHASGFDHLLEVNPSAQLYLPDDDTLGAPYQWNFSPPPEGLPREQAYFSGEKEAFLYDPGDRFRAARTEFVGEHKQVAPGVFLLAMESKLTGDFSRYPPHQEEPYLWGLPELSLVLVTEEGLVVVTGCSHSGVEEIVRVAKKELEKEVALVVGGYHLMPYGADSIARLAATMKEELGVRRVAPAHCTGHRGFKIFRQVYGEDYVFAGLGEEIRLAP